jgi:hypothetical protein
MPVIALVLFIVAAVLFALAAWEQPHSWRLVPLGLAVLTVGFICQFLIHSGIVT